MKKKFEIAEVRVIKFEAMDIMTASFTYDDESYQGVTDTNEISAINMINDKLIGQFHGSKIVLLQGGTVSKTGLKPSEYITTSDFINANNGNFLSNCSTKM